MPKQPTAAETARILDVVERLKPQGGNSHFIGGLIYHLSSNPTQPLWQAMLSAAEAADTSKGEYTWSKEEMAEMDALRERYKGGRGS